MVRWRELLVVPLLALSTIACVKRVEPFYEARITWVESPTAPGTVWYAHGVITNLADFPMEFEVQLDLQVIEAWAWGKALAVLPGQTAVWAAPYVRPGYKPQIGIVKYTQVWPDPVHGRAVITGAVPADFGGPFSEITGTVTNTGTKASGYAVELQGDNGAINVGYVSQVAPGQTVPWDQAIFRGKPPVRVVRVANWPPPGQIPVP
jgi:hypothetical protein